MTDEELLSPNPPRCPQKMTTTKADAIAHDRKVGGNLSVSRTVVRQPQCPAKQVFQRFSEVFPNVGSIVGKMPTHPFRAVVSDSSSDNSDSDTDRQQQRQ